MARRRAGRVVETRYPRRQDNTGNPVAKFTESDMTESEEDPLSHTQKLEDIVDGLDEKVAGEREAEGLPGRPSDRENTVVRGSEDEPPD